jgi:hypothetical protein
MASKPETVAAPAVHAATEAPGTALASRDESAKAGIVIGRSGLMPTTFDALWRLAVIMAKSEMMPKGVTRPEQIFVAVQLGLEVGLSPMQAVQNIAVINGHPSLWGDAVLALVLSSPVCEYVHEEPIIEKGKLTGWTCHAKRRGVEQEVVRSFTEADARQAKLWEKKGKDGQDTPWITYPNRMLQMRARAFALRDAFADVLKGMSVREEAEDIEILGPAVPSVTDKQDALRGRLEVIKQRSAEEARPVQTALETVHADAESGDLFRDDKREERFDV